MDRMKTEPQKEPVPWYLVALAILYFVGFIGFLVAVLMIEDEVSSRDNCDPLGPMEAAQCRSEGRDPAVWVRWRDRK